MGLREILANPAIPDAQEVILADGVKVTVGELRSTVSENDADKGRLTQAQAELSGLWTRIQEASRELEAARSAPPNPAVAAAADPAGYDWRKDSYLEGVAREYDAMAQRVAAAEEIANRTRQETRDALLEVAKVYMNDRWDRDFESLQDRPADMTREKLLRYAVENGIVDKDSNIPNLRKAFEKMTEPQRKTKELEAAAARGREEARMENTARVLHRPISGLPAASGDAAKPSGKKAATSPVGMLNEAFARAAADRSIFGGGATPEA